MTTHGIGRVQLSSTDPAGIGVELTFAGASIVG